MPRIDAAARAFSLAALLLAAGCATPGVLREPVRGATYAPIRADLPPLPGIMERTGDPPIALPEPTNFTPIAAPRSDRAAPP